MVNTFILIFFMIFLFKFRKTLAPKIVKHLTLNAGPLHEQCLFRWAVITPVVISLIIFLLTDHGISNFWKGTDQRMLVDNSKLPLLIAALSPILGSIVSNLHRTVQTDKQIKEAGKKNLSDSYITHQKVCLENLNHINNKFELMWLPNATGVHKVDFKINLNHIKMNRIYQIFFPNNNLQVGVVTYKPKDLLEELESFIESRIVEVLSKEAADEYFTKINDFILKEKKGEVLIFTEIGRYISSLDKDKFLAEFKSGDPNVLKSPRHLLEFTLTGCRQIARNHYVQFDIESKNLVRNQSLGMLVLPEKKYALEDAAYQILVREILTHLVDMAVAMGEEKNTYPTLTRIKGLAELLKRIAILIKQNRGFI